MMFRLGNRKLGIAFAAAACACALPRAWGADPTGVRREPLSISTAFDIGQIVKGESADENPVRNVDGQMIQRTGVTFTQATRIGADLKVEVGVGGLFFYGFPEQRNEAGSRSVRFGPGVGRALAEYAFGPADGSGGGALRFGYFPYKYDPDAKNLGEYLLRSGAYPGYEMTGGWSIIDNAQYMASGLSLSARGPGGLRGDLNLFLEHDLEPLYDLSPSLVAAWRPVPAFEAGLGAAFAHLIPVQPSKLHSRSQKYLGDTLAAPGDSGAAAYTFQGIKAMARVSFDLAAALGADWTGPSGLKLYAEAAVLGIRDYPYFYSDVTRRIPVMAGLDLPAFRLLDKLAVEGEYRRWDFDNNTQEVLESVDPVWTVPGGDWHAYAPSAFKGRGDLKWTVYAKRRLMPGLTLTAQAASDHMRGIDWEKAVFNRSVVTRRTGQWYYLARLEFGL